MKSIRLTILVILCSSLVALVVAQPKQQTDQSPQLSADALFVMDKVWTVHLTVTAEDYQKMMPEMPQRGFGPPGFGPPPGGAGNNGFPPPPPPGAGGIETIPRINRLPNLPPGGGPGQGPMGPLNGTRVPGSPCDF